MARRTKKDKLTPRHPFLITWEKNAAVKPVVKGQLTSVPQGRTKTEPQAKNADIQAKELNIAWVKRDIVKSLLFASLILGLEIVLYLAWNK